MFLYSPIGPMALEHKELKLKSVDNLKYHPACNLDYYISLEISIHNPNMPEGEIGYYFPWAIIKQII